MQILDLDHVQIAMPPGEEAKARAFFGGLLGLIELEKPASLAARGGVWFQLGKRQLHIGVDPDFRAATKAHPAFLVRDLPAFVRRLEASGISPVEDHALPGYRRFYVCDPFGNRLELMERNRDGESA